MLATQRLVRALRNRDRDAKDKVARPKKNWSLGISFFDDRDERKECKLFGKERNSRDIQKLVKHTNGREREREV